MMVFHRLRQALMGSLGALLFAFAPPLVRAQDCPPAAQPPTPAQMQAAQAAARDRGFLWRITKDGRSSYLFGTLHLGKLDWVFPGPAVRQAMADTDTLALELDLTDPATARELVAASAGAGKPAVLPAGLQQRLARQTAAACLPAGALDAQHPVMRAITLVVLDARREGLDPGFGQEFMLAGAARARGVPIVALETVALQMGTLIPDTEAQTVESLHQALDQLESGSARRSSARMAAAWAEGRLEELEQYEQWCDCVPNEDARAFLRRLNDERNPGLAERIDALHGAGKRVFAAVGALHMTGAQSLPGLLARRGYAVARVAYAR
jgi:hypothetical protein